MSVDGKTMPMLGYRPLGSGSKLEDNLRLALDGGYRRIVCLPCRDEEVIPIMGKVLHEYISSGKIKREDLWITTRLPSTAHDSADVITCVESQLKDLQLDYIDLILMDPCPFKRQEGSFKPLLENGELVPHLVPHIDTWRVLEKLYHEKKLRALGVSRFNEKQLTDLYEETEIKPFTISIECHIYWPNMKMRRLCKTLGIQVTSNCPVGRDILVPPALGRKYHDIIEKMDPDVLAIGKKYNKTSVQVFLRHLIQADVAVTLSTSAPEEIVESCSIFDFELSSEEMENLNDERRESDADAVICRDYDHPWFPHKGSYKHRHPRHF